MSTKANFRRVFGLFCPRPSYPALRPRRPKNVKLAPLTQSPVTMIMLYGFMGYLNHVDLPMPHAHVFKKQPDCLLCT